LTNIELITIIHNVTIHFTAVQIITQLLQYTQAFGQISDIQYRSIRFSIGLRQIGHSCMRSPHIWQVPCPQRKIMFFRRSIQTGQHVCSTADNSSVQ